MQHTAIDALDLPGCKVGQKGRMPRAKNAGESRQHEHSGSLIAGITSYVVGEQFMVVHRHNGVKIFPKLISTDLGLITSSSPVELQCLLMPIGEPWSVYIVTMPESFRATFCNALQGDCETPSFMAHRTRDVDRPEPPRAFDHIEETE